MNNAVLGIDIGTSALKILYVQNGKILQRSRCSYEEESPEGWWKAFLSALSDLQDLSSVRAVGFSSQVGTYLINGQHLLPWSSPEGAEYVDRILERYPEEDFIPEIGMPHPRLSSYPLPKLWYAAARYGSVTRVLQPKDLFVQRLTGQCVSDPYSWRGLAHTASGDTASAQGSHDTAGITPCTYSRRFLRDAGIDPSALPALKMPWETAGRLLPEAAARTGLPAGLPVYTGLNDFYAALLGMGIHGPGCWFDITGSSEHLGLVEEQLHTGSDLISSPFFSGYVHYGVTASSGVSLSFRKEVFPCDIRDPRRLLDDAPVFLPYLNGERAPVFDPAARGTFYGITGKTGAAHMADAVQEGVAFSIFHIYSHLGAEGGDSVRVCGGASGNPLLNYLKAELLQKTITVIGEKDASALGGAVTALLGEWLLSSIREAAGLAGISEEVRPDGRLRRRLLERFDIYTALYRRVRGL